MGRFDIFPIFIATFASRRVTLIATHSKSQKQTRLPIRYLYFIFPFKPLINKEVIKVFQNYTKYLEPNNPFSSPSQKAKIIFRSGCLPLVMNALAICRTADTPEALSSAPL